MDIWHIRISAPTGEIPATLRVDHDGGTMEGKAGSGPMADLSRDGARLRWATKIDRPMPMTLKFDGTVDGDAIAGTVRFGLFASGTFAGTKGSDGDDGRAAP
ncbi:hypothetical protein JQC91_11500 [Jannaschia sp. Os4]|uniref:hypothetical protein n=1 Tax=Jannaschia sp. Os4 TaxID=2807617 RepID=UPI00193A0630|nr:hypothetical protein [Jannaschia sp. Os4]MBM2576924.1 hypothetical protein [Jannaschia sp. Os4]